MLNYLQSARMQERRHCIVDGPASKNPTMHMLLACSLVSGAPRGMCKPYDIYCTNLSPALAIDHDLCQYHLQSPKAATETAITRNRRANMAPFAFP